LHTCPYHNAWIISVIRDLYFSGGTTSYAYRFEEYVFFFFFDATGFVLKYICSHFPTFKGDNGLLKREVPIPMVALVATAVSAAMYS
jgi:hypothetical protein